MTPAEWEAVSEAADALASRAGEIEELRKLLAPLAAIVPSSLYSDSDDEGYVLSGVEPYELKDLTRQDILRARNFLSRKGSLA